MQIKGFIDTSFIEWNGKITSIVFTPTCNLRCNFCYNYGLVLTPENYESLDEEVIFMWLNDNRDFIDAVCITGGEPTLQKDVAEFCAKLKTLGFLIKFDTNGTNPEKLEELIEKKLIDYVAMDIKAPLESEKYSGAAGVEFDSEKLGKIKKTIGTIISSGIDHEFRTTVVPDFHSERDIEAIALSIKGARRYFLQKFQPATRYESMNKLKTQSDEEMEKLKNIAKEHIENVEWRGK